ncbi:unnamed protein product [Vicia faba]|uniref:Uncharacterized protein n=1 Tax=Vicia faba TaxID=3906 RepID=A0AAV0YMK3_VICFA|nr:unnamed protein product [Vicia faba]
MSQPMYEVSGQKQSLMCTCFKAQIGDSYWWVLCVEKSFKEQGTPKKIKLPEVVTKLYGHARQWWFWGSQLHPPLCWDTFTTVFLWHFKFEWREIFPIEEEEDPDLKSMKTIEGTSFLEDLAPIPVSNKCV